MQWQFLNVKNVAQQRKADANRRNALTVLKLVLCRSRRKRNLAAAAVPVPQKNKLTRKPLPFWCVRGFLHLILKKSLQHLLSSCRFAQLLRFLLRRYPDRGVDSFDISCLSLYFSFFRQLARMRFARWNHAKCRKTLSLEKDGNHATENSCNRRRCSRAENCMPR